MLKYERYAVLFGAFFGLRSFSEVGSVVVEGPSSLPAGRQVSRLGHPAHNFSADHQKEGAGYVWNRHASLPRTKLSLDGPVV